jgi:hypothetical protein
MAPRFVVILISFVSCLCIAKLLHAQSPTYGKFLDELNVSLDPPGGHKMKLLNDYRFQDPKGEIWLAKKGSIVDGASIPWIFWTIIGGPLDGPYRNASVIHDYYCVTRTKDWQETHRVFYYGMRAAAVDPVKALTMYYAVLAFGPRWGRQSRNSLVCEEKDGKVVCGPVIVNEEERVDIPTTQEDLQDVENFERQLRAAAEIPIPDIERMALSKGNPRFPRELRR